MKLTHYLILATLALTACGKDTRTVAVEVPAPAPAPSETQRVVDEENAYRLGQGQAALTQGLSCTVQQVSGGAWLSNASPGYNAGQGVVTLTGTAYAYLLTRAFDQADTAGGGSNLILPAPLRGVFASINYKLSCSGQLVTTETGYYSFELASDDGSILSLDGAQLINNDGNHGIQEKSGVKYLRRGVHSFSLQYAQSGGGSFALTLKSGGVLVPGSAFYH